MRTLIAMAVACLSLSVFALGGVAGGGKSMMPDSTVIEVVTLKLKSGISYSTFVPIDKAVEDQHVSKQPGFVSRQAAAGENGEWFVIVHWKSVAEAEASMATFMQAPAAKTFMDHIDASTMVMKRYTPAQ